MKYSTQYLYACEPTEFADLPYREALAYKIDKANLLLVSLTYVPWQTRDEERVGKVLDAIKLNKQLLKELQ